MKEKNSTHFSPFLKTVLKLQIREEGGPCVPAFMSALNTTFLT